jgi:hypothetical protein
MASTLKAILTTVQLLITFISDWQALELYVEHVSYRFQIRMVANNHGDLQVGQLPTLKAYEQVI